MPALFVAGPRMLELLKLLQDGRFHSGEALGAKLGISRSAIWKQLQGLEAELGIEVFKVPGRGYRLSSPMTLLDAGEISHGAEGLAWPITVESSVDSTNAEIFRRLDAGVRAPFVLLAERQTAGRGRRGPAPARCPASARPHPRTGCRPAGCPRAGCSSAAALTFRTRMTRSG